MTTVLLTAVLLGSIALQALMPGRRLVIVLTGAGVSCLIGAVTNVAPTSRVLAEVPWDVLVMLVGLGLLTELLAASGMFGKLAVWLTRVSGANHALLVVMFCAVMYLVSGLVNNLTALLLVLPLMLVQFRLLGVTQRYLTWSLGAMLVACNLGGAATPIGDFPAILLLGRGAMDFNDYLTRAAPATAVALAAFLVLVAATARPARDVPRSRVSARITVATMQALHRGLKLDIRALVPGGTALVAMMAAWISLPASTGVRPELICWLGVSAALVGSGRLGERLVRSKVDIEATLFLLALFVMVGTVRATGAFAAMAQDITVLPIPPAAQVVVFLVAAAVLTGLFSAGPSMAALLEVAEVLAARHPPAAIYVGLAMSVCAGSSLFITAATSGPLTQALVERAELRGADGNWLRFGFVDFMPVGALGFGVILCVGIAVTLLQL